MKVKFTQFPSGFRLNPLNPKSDQHQILIVISMLCKTEWS